MVERCTIVGPKKGERKEGHGEQCVMETLHPTHTMVGSQEGNNEEGEELVGSGNSTMLGQEYLYYGGAGADVTTQYSGGVREDVFIGAVETGHMEMGFEVCDVRRPLAAVSRMTSRGNRVVFGPEGEDNYIQHVESGKKVMMRKKGGAMEERMW